MPLVSSASFLKHPQRTTLPLNLEHLASARQVDFVNFSGYDFLTESQFNTNLLTIPYNVFHIFTLLGITWLSEKLNERALTGMLQSVWTLPCIIALAVWPGLMKNGWGTYALITVLLSYPYCHAINV
jgi:hypothetical protein